MLGLGLLAGLGFAPIYLLPGWFIGLAGLIWIARLAESRREAFLGAWWWSLGQTIPGIYWITSSFLIDAARFGWLAAPVVGALATYLALFPALSILAAWHARKNSWAFVLALAGSWTIMELARGWALTGFPWNLAAYVWGFATPMMQSAAIWGAWGLSLVTMLIGGMLAMALARPWRRAGAPLAIGAALLLALLAFGAWRLGQPGPAATDITLRLVQANISQWDKLTGKDRAGQAIKHLKLSLQPGEADFDAVIWPETAATFFLDRQPDWRGLIASAAPAGGYVITGGLRGEPPLGDPQTYWNSLYAIDRLGTVRATSDKFHLVPLGEFVPLRHLFPFIRKLTGGGGNFSSGLGPVTLQLPGLPGFSPLICYEAIFPGAVTDPSDRPEWLLNLTNDGWFGNSSGPYQHFASARFRAVEEGLPLIRAANSGVSGAVDSLGRIVAQTEFGESVVLDVRLPGALPPTMFQAWGLFPVGFLIIVCAVLSFGFATYNRRNHG